jgi:transcriptional regulator with XRE-family HTH domain
VLLKIEYHIHEIRSRRRISLRQLEMMSGVSKSQISAIENNKEDARVTTICMLAEALGLSLSDVLSYTRVQ